MLTREKIEALLKIDTKNEKDNRYLRVMSCENPVKELYVYHLKEIRNEFKENPRNFDEQLVLCFRKFISSIHLYLEGHDVQIYTKSCAVKLDRQLIQDAKCELLNFYNLINKVYSNNKYALEELEQIATYRIPNYIAILQLCGIIDINEDIFRSKFLARFLNIKDQVRSYREKRMSLMILASEFSDHLEYLSEQLNIINDYNISDEDFLAYAILFDIRHFKLQRRKKILKL